MQLLYPVLKDGIHCDSLVTERDYLPLILRNNRLYYVTTE